MAQMAETREAERLIGARLPRRVIPTADVTKATQAPILLLAVPTQALRTMVSAHRPLLAGRMLVACCKGVERGTGQLPTEVLRSELPDAPVAVLTGPSFAAEIAVGRPTALTLASDHPDIEALQATLMTPVLRLYRTEDMTGAQLGGALKNVIAIAAGMAIGQGLGESARSALITRGFSEIVQFAESRGAQKHTLYGLSGFGDLVLTCTSLQSRNFRFGLAFGANKRAEGGQTVEGVMTAHAVAEAATESNLPVTRAVSAVLKGESSLDEAIAALMSRPPRHEWQ
jgi:glycerol-3-phosphate dehydrogenase (NAD(P)+)